MCNYVRGCVSRSHRWISLLSALVSLVTQIASSGRPYRRLLKRVMSWSLGSPLIYQWICPGMPQTPSPTLQHMCQQYCIPTAGCILLCWVHRTTEEGWYQSCCTRFLRKLYPPPGGFGYWSMPRGRHFERESGGTHHFSIYSFLVFIPWFDRKVISVPVVGASPISLSFFFCLLSKLDALIQTSICKLSDLR